MYPQAEISLYCRKGLGDFFRNYQLVNDFVEVDKSKRADSAKPLRQLKQKKFDLVVSPHESWRTQVFVWGIKAKRKIGYQNFWNGFIFHERHVRDWSLPEPLRQLKLLERIDRATGDFFSLEAQSLANVRTRKSPVNFSSLKIPGLASMEIPLTTLRPSPSIDACIEKMNRLTSQHGIDRARTVFMSPGSVWETKKWKLSGYIELAQRLAKDNMQVVLTGSQSEHGLCQKVAEATSTAINLAGQTNLFETSMLLRKGRAIVTNDSGAMHIAAVAGLPTVAVFGPTTLELGFRPWQHRAVVVQNDLNCRPCGLHGHKKCPIGTHACMKNIKTDEVYSALHGLL